MPDFLLVIVVIGLAFLGGAVRFQQLYTALKSGERKLRELEGRLLASQREASKGRTELDVILSSMVEGVLVIGRDDKIQYISPNLSKMFDFRSPDVRDRPYWEVVPHAQVISAIKEVMAAGTAVAREMVIFGAEDVTFNVQISPVNSEGGMASAVAVFHDISALKKLLRLRTEFVANVSHELKTPLTSIKGYVETLLEEGGLEDKEAAAKFLKIVGRQTERLEALVRDLLTLSAIENKEAAFDFKAVELRGIINNALHALKTPLNTAQHQVTVHLPQELPMIAVDRLRIEQVFINLIDNAVKFTPKGGRVDITASFQYPWVIIDVKDSGIGIPAEHLPRLFERFYRVDQSRSSELGGTGLGLAIVKHIIQAHQGRVQVQSTLGTGSTFTVCLPCQR